MLHRRLLTLAVLALLPAAQAVFAAPTAGSETPLADAPTRFTVSGETLLYRHSADGRFSVNAQVHSTPSEPATDLRFRLHATSNDKAACSIGGASVFADGFES